MKKVVLAALAVFVFGFSDAQEVKFGAKAGLNITSLAVGSSVGKGKSGVGFHIGGLAEIKFTEKMSLQPELLYSQESADFNFDDNIFGTTLSYKQKIKTSKIALPIMFKYYVIKNLSIEAGPQLDYLLSAKSNTTVNIANVATITNDINLNDNSSMINTTINSTGETNSDIAYQDHGLKKLNFAFNLGAGYELPMGVFFQARYSLGLTKFVDNANPIAGTDATGTKLLDSGVPSIDNKYDNTSFKASNFQFSVGYKF